MKYLKQTWIRVVLALVAGGFAAEIIAINSGDPNHRSSPDNSSIYVLIFGCIAYFILTAIAGKNDR